MRKKKKKKANDYSWLFLFALQLIALSLGNLPQNIRDLLIVVSILTGQIIIKEFK